MSNRTIAANLEEILEEFSRGRLTATEVEGTVERSIQAMEGLSSRDVDHSRDLTYRLVVAELEDESEGSAKSPQAQTALKALKGLLDELGSK